MSDQENAATPRLKFADEHVDAILGGRKTVTIRRDIDAEEFQIGRRFELCAEDGERFASAYVDDRGWTTIAMAARMDFEGHRDYRDADELLDELGQYYPDQDLDEQSKVELVYWGWEELWE